MVSNFFDWVAELERSGYTIPMTIIYALLVLLGLYILYRWIKHIKLPLSTSFVLSSCLYVILGGFLHVLDDMVDADGVPLIAYPWRLLFTTPTVYILVMVFGIAVLFVSYTLEKRNCVDSYIKPYTICGIISCLAVFGIHIWYGLTHNGIDMVAFGCVIGIALAATAALWAFLRYVCRWTYISHPLYLALMGAQFLDASATGFALQFRGYVEQHVLGGWLINLTKTGYSMFILKVIVLVLGIWILEKFKKEEGVSILWHLIIIVMIIVGLGPAVRDLLRMMLGI